MAQHVGRPGCAVGTTEECSLSSPERLGGGDPGLDRTSTSTCQRAVRCGHDVCCAFFGHFAPQLMELTPLACCRVARVDGALYAFCSLLVICANLGGMALVLTLRRQIRYVSYRDAKKTLQF